jgi:ATP-binding cassette subfamily B protein
VAAARAANAHEFILRLPHAYDSLVGERGQALSGGERQRISHRAGAADRPAHPDPRRGDLVGRYRAPRRRSRPRSTTWCSGRTTIAIAHRLSTLRRADRLVVLDRGEVVETGHP